MISWSIDSERKQLSRCLETTLSNTHCKFNAQVICINKYVSTYRTGFGSMGDGARIRYNTRSRKIPSATCKIIVETGLETKKQHFL